MGTMINRRRVMGGKSLPYDAEIEYLESTGRQYIDTGLDYFADFEVGIKLRQSVSNKVLGNGAFYCLQRNSSVEPYWLFTSGNSYFTRVPITKYHVMKWKENKIYADDTFIANYTKNLNKPSRMYLYSVTVSSVYPNMIYFCKLWEPDSGLLVRDFIPVRVGQIGYMYDRVSGQLFGNQGTGNFILGPDKQ